MNLILALLDEQTSAACERAPSSSRYGWVGPKNCGLKQASEKYLFIT